jgi:hypothetical protein
METKPTPHSVVVVGAKKFPCSLERSESSEPAVDRIQAMDSVLFNFAGVCTGWESWCLRPWRGSGHEQLFDGLVPRIGIFGANRLHSMLSQRESIERLVEFSDSLEASLIFVEL